MSKGKVIKNINTENEIYLNNKVEELGINYIAKAVAGFLYSVEYGRLQRVKRGYKVEEYIFPSISTIMKNTNIKGNITVGKAIETLCDANVILKIEKGKLKVSSKYYMNPEYLNTEEEIKKLKAPSLSQEEKIDMLLQMVMELKEENKELNNKLTELNNKLININNESIYNNNESINESKEVVEQEEVVEYRSIPMPQEAETATMPQSMTQRMSKILERYDTIYKRETPKEPFNLAPNPQSLEVEIIEQRSIPQETKKENKIDYSKYKLTDSIIKCGTCSLMYLSPEELKREIEVREKNNVDIKDVLKICKLKGVAV